VTADIVEFSLAALADVDALADELAARVAAGEADLAADVLIPADDVRQVCGDLLRDFYRYLAGIAPLDLQAVRAVGRRRADQGVPLAAVLHGFRIGVRFAWEHLVRALGADSTPAVLARSDLLWSILDDYSAELRAAYAEAAADRTRLLQSQSNEQVDILLGTTAAELSKRWEAADALGLPRRGRFQVIIVDHPAEGVRRSVEAGLRDVRSAWRVSPDELVAVLSLGKRAGYDVPVEARIGVSPVFEQVGDAGPARHRARIAVAGLPSTGVGIRRYGEDPVATLVASAADTAHDLAQRVLGPVFALPAHECALLLDTLQAWFAAGGSTDQTAAALFCHRNTVRYRLRRLEELTTFQPADPRAAAQLYLALETVAQQGVDRFAP
jgi:hypothetical protein